MCCCTKTKELGCFCCAAKVATGYIAPEAGIYTFEISYLGRTIKKRAFLDFGDPIAFTFTNLNTNYEYTFSVYDPEGLKMFLNIEFDCFRFTVKQCFDIADEPAPGEPDFLEYEDFVATEAIAQFKVVTWAGNVARSSNPNDKNRIIGLAITNYAIGVGGQSQITGKMTNVSWNWNEGDILYVDSSGDLTASIPLSGFIQQVAIAVSTNRIKILIGAAIEI